MSSPERFKGQSILVLGATSGMARATAAQFSAAGATLVLGARDRAEAEIIALDLNTRYQAAAHALTFDALDFSSHAACLDEAEKLAGKPVDGLLIFFGYMTDQKIAQEDFEAARRTIDTNLTAVISVAEHFARRCEASRAGFIAIVSSVAGDRGRQSNYIYGAAKAGLSAYVQGLRNRLHAAGVPVTTIKPGFVDTKMTHGMKLPKPLVVSPETAARGIFKAVAARKNTAYVPFFWRYIMLIIKAIPEWQFKKMKL